MVVVSCCRPRRRVVAKNCRGQLDVLWGSFAISAGASGAAQAWTQYAAAASSKTGSRKLCIVHMRILSCLCLFGERIIHG